MREEEIQEKIQTGIQTKIPNILDDNKVDVDIEPKVNGNYTVINLCSLYCIFGGRKLNSS